MMNKNKNNKNEQWMMNKNDNDNDNEQEQNNGGGQQVMSHASYILSLSDDILILLDDRCDLS